MNFDRSEVQGMTNSNFVSSSSQTLAQAFGVPQITKVIPLGSFRYGSLDAICAGTFKG